MTYAFHIVWHSWQRAEGAMLAPKIRDLTEHIFFEGPEPTWEWMGKSTTGELVK